MKISQARIHPFRLKLRSPLRTARGTIAAREGWLIALVGEAGVWGIGEASPLAGFGMESLAECGEALRRWTEILGGVEIREVQLRTGGWSSLAPVALGNRTPAAAHGIELALLDLAARRAGLPLARWLDPGAAEAVTVNATLSAEAPAPAAERAAAFAREGFGTIKIKAGADAFDADLARVAAVRAAVGPAIRLRVDANGAWTRDAALEALRALAPYGIEYAEQPVAADDLEGLAWIAARSPVPVAADEAACSPEQAGRVLEMGAAHVLILKPMALGGIVATLQLVRRAAQAGVTCVITTTIDGAIARAGALHAAAAACALLPASPPAFGLATGGMLAEDLVPDAPKPERGVLRWSGLPGLGFAHPPAGIMPRDTGR